MGLRRRAAVAASIPPCYYVPNNLLLVSPLSFQETVAVVRDIAFLSTFAVVILLALLMYWKVSRILDSARRAIDNVENITSLVSTNIAGPAAAGSGLASGAGKLAAFLFGLSGNRGSKGEDSDGK